MKGMVKGFAKKTASQSPVPIMFYQFPRRQGRVVFFRQRAPEKSPPYP